MTPTPEIFLDTSALFAGIWSESGGGRRLLQLGEAGVIQLFVSGQVLTEIERTIRKRTPEQLPNLAVLLEQSRLHVCEKPPPELIARCEGLTGYANDAIVLAAAWSANTDYFVTLDKRHFLNNTVLRTDVPFLLGTPGDCLTLLRRRLLEG